MALLKLCNCGRTISINEQSCDACSKDNNITYDKYRRDKKSTTFYKSEAWKLKRREALNKHKGLCLHCLANKKIKYADMVDHIEPIKFNWSLRLDIDNLQPLCNVCHNAKTAIDKANGKG